MVGTTASTKICTAGGIPGSAVHNAFGDREQAPGYFEQACRPSARSVTRAGEATTLNNGAVYDGLGDREQALSYYAQALPIRREVGDRVGETVPRYNIAAIHHAMGDLRTAVITGRNRPRRYATIGRSRSPNLTAHRRYPGIFG